jgi:hypothetical protein
MYFFPVFLALLWIDWYCDTRTGEHLGTPIVQSLRAHTANVSRGRKRSGRIPKPSQLDSTDTINACSFLYSNPATPARKVVSGAIDLLLAFNRTSFARVNPWREVPHDLSRRVDDNPPNFFTFPTAHGGECFLNPLLQ